MTTKKSVHLQWVMKSLKKNRIQCGFLEARHLLIGYGGYVNSKSHWMIYYITCAIKNNLHLQEISSITSYINLSLRAFSMAQLLLMLLEIRNSGATTSCQS